MRFFVEAVSAGGTSGARQHMRRAGCALSRAPSCEGGVRATRLSGKG